MQNSPLTDKGRKQAFEVGSKLVGLGVSLVVSSPLDRAVVTSEIIGSYTDTPVVRLPQLKPQAFGLLEGLTIEEATQKGLSEFIHTDSTDKYLHKVPGGESAQEVESRVIPIFNVLNRVTEREGLKTVLVTHNSVVRAIAGNVWSMLPDQWSTKTIPNTLALKFGEGDFNSVETNGGASDQIFNVYQHFRHTRSFADRSKLARILAVRYPDNRDLIYGLAEESDISKCCEDTSKLLAVRDELAKYFQPYANSILHYGSSSCGPYFSVSSTSDLDLDIVVDDIDINLSSLLVGAENAENILRDFKKSGADICSFKFQTKGVVVNIRLTPQKVHERIALTDPFSRNVGCISDYRERGRPTTPHRSAGFGFDGVERLHDPEVTQTEHGVIVKRRLGFVDAENKYVSGPTIDKYITCRGIYGDVSGVSERIFSLKRNLVNRLMYEQENGILDSNASSFCRVMARSRRMPRHLVQSFDAEELVIKELTVLTQNY